MNNNNYRNHPRTRNRRFNKKKGSHFFKRRQNTGPTRPQAGLLSFHREGYGFLIANKRTFKQRPEQDCFVPIQMIRKFGLREGSYIEGMVSREQKKGLYVLCKVFRVDGFDPEAGADRPYFNKLKAIDPTEMITMENSSGDLTLRVLDLITPIGKGQRGIVISPPRSGKTILLQKIANSVHENYPEIHVMVVLIDERPEEVTDWCRSTKAEILSSSADESPANHVRVSKLALLRAKRLVESGKDVMVLIDSITRLGRAHNMNTKETGRTLSGGLDASVLDKPKAFIGAARDLLNGGSLTIIGTCLVDTGSRMDQIIYEEFKGTGNMECVLSRKLSDMRIFPALDIKVSGTRKEEKLIPTAKLRQIWVLRRVLQKLELLEGSRIFIEKLGETKTNNEFLASFSSNSIGSYR